MSCRKVIVLFVLAAAVSLAAGESEEKSSNSSTSSSSRFITVAAGDIPISSQDPSEASKGGDSSASKSSGGGKFKFVFKIAKGILSWTWSIIAFIYSWTVQPIINVVKPAVMLFAEPVIIPAKIALVPFELATPVVKESAKIGNTVALKAVGSKGWGDVFTKIMMKVNKGISAVVTNIGALISKVFEYLKFWKKPAAPSRSKRSVTRAAGNVVETPFSILKKIILAPLYIMTKIATLPFKIANGIAHLPLFVASSGYDIGTFPFRFILGVITAPFRMLFGQKQKGEPSNVQTQRIVNSLNGTMNKFINSISESTRRSMVKIMYKFFELAKTDLLPQLDTMLVESENMNIWPNGTKAYIDEFHKTYHFMHVLGMM